jgi:1,4-dihydroxy-2-naphthoate octaprenyltransferase
LLIETFDGANPFAPLRTLGAAMLVGVYLVWVGGVPILVVGLASLVCALAYSGGPFPLASHGLGDPFVFVFFGLVAVGGSYWVQALQFTPDTLVAGAGIGALTTAILVVNNLRDIPTDAQAGKRTLAVRIGVRGSRIEYTVLVLVAAAAPVVGIFGFGWTPWTLLGLIAFTRVVSPLSAVWTFKDPRRLNSALGETARVVAWYGGLMAVGFFLGVPQR